MAPSRDESPESLGEQVTGSDTDDPGVGPGRTAGECPLCFTSGGRLFFADSRRYLRCAVCGLVFVPSDQFLSPGDEKAVYDRHQNSPDDPRYRRFLGRLFNPVSERLPPGRRGLDFGSGPGPTLSVMFEEVGHSMTNFDPFYAPDASVLERQYDFVTASEVVEHLHHPRRELDRLWSCLEPGGVLGIMTKRVIDQQRFADWHYKNDPSHVCFFSVETFEWLAVGWGTPLTVVGDDVVLFTKPAAPADGEQAEGVRARSCRQVP